MEENQTPQLDLQSQILGTENTQVELDLGIDLAADSGAKKDKKSRKEKKEGKEKKKKSGKKKAKKDKKKKANKQNTEAVLDVGLDGVQAIGASAGLSGTEVLVDTSNRYIEEVVF